tara:strand:+ start:1169 stop:1297 length:129 start_codon:yes stop_codon:yes gene_type:complete
VSISSARQEETHKRNTKDPAGAALARRKIMVTNIFELIVDKM